MTITHDLSTDIGKIRLIIQDTAGARFSDEELQVFLDLEGSVILAAAAALEAWAAHLSESAASEKIGDYAYTKKSAENKLDLAARYRENDANAPALDWASFNFTDIDETEACE